MKNEDLYITLKEAADRLLMRTTTVQKIFDEGHIDGKVVDGQLLLNERYVDELVRAINVFGPLVFDGRRVITASPRKPSDERRHKA
jgi:hypothetical protein